MGDYYHNFLTHMGGCPPGIHPIDPDGVPITGSGATSQGVAPVPLAPSSITLPFSPAPYFQGTGPLPDVYIPNSQGQKWRKNYGGIMEPVKHRRTRSGCLVCRTRRIKCDENRPICERCKKGDRECVFPPPKPPKAKSKKKKKPVTSPANPAIKADSAPASVSPSGPILVTSTNDQPVNVNESCDSDDDDDYEKSTEIRPEGQGLETIKDEEEPSPSNTYSSSWPSVPDILPRDNAHKMNQAMTYVDNSLESLVENTSSYSASVSPATSTGASSSVTTDISPNSQSSLIDYSHLSAEHQQALNWFHKNITHYHYGVISDPDLFFSITLPNLALYEDSLLYGLVAFSRYLQTLENPDGDINDFITPFNASVTLLLGQLRKSSPTIVMLATILQLATIEEYLGDWVSLSGHQTAAKTFLTQLYTIDNIMYTPIGRVLLAWYSRYDCFVGIIGRLPTALGHEWFQHYVDNMDHRASSNPHNVQVLQEQGAAHLRICSEEIAQINFMMTRGQLTLEQYCVQHGRISAMINGYFNNMNPRLLDPAHVIDFAALGVEPDPFGVVDLTDMSVKLYEAPLFGVNILRAEFHSIIMMHNFRQAMADRSGPIFKDCQKHAYAICHIFEGIEKYPYNPKGALILVQACLGLAAMFLTPDSNHRNWLRRKFALVEKIGYIQSATSRNAMTMFFNDPTTAHWWLPNEKGFTNVLKALRSYNEDRVTRAKVWQEELRDVNHIFGSLSISN